MRRLPILQPIRKRELRMFELRETIGIAFRTLTHAVGVSETLRILVAVGKRGLFHDPLRVLPAPQDDAEVLTRMQLRPVVLLYDALRDELHYDHALTIRLVNVVVQRCGASFMQWMLKAVDLQHWAGASNRRRYESAGSLLRRMFNMSTHDLSVSSGALEFRVTQCSFVRTLRLLDRMELAPMFCEVDRTFFDRPESPMRLKRTTTLATGGSHCDFSFLIAQPVPEAPETQPSLPKSGPP